MSYSPYHSNPLIDLCTAIKSLLTLIEENVHDNAGVLSGADIQKSRSSGIVMLAGKYGILDKIWLGIS